LVNLILTKEDCKACETIEKTDDDFIVDANSEFGKFLVKKFGISHVPEILKVDKVEIGEQTKASDSS